MAKSNAKSSENVPATIDDSLLNLWNQNKTGEDIGGENGPRIPILKLIQPQNSALEQCKHGNGAWVIGFKRDKDGKIIDHGHKVKGLVILAVRNRYAYYDQNNTNMNCTTSLFTNFQDAVGSKHKYYCSEKTCPYRMKEGNPKCRAQKVVFGVAITADETLMDCIVYIQGSTYMPFSKYLEEDLTRIRTKQGFVDAPTYGFVTYLGYEQKMNGAVVYFEGKFKRGDAPIGSEQFMKFHEKHLEALKLIDSMNRTNSRSADEAPSNGNASQGNRPGNMPPVGDSSVYDLPPAAPPMEDDIPFDLGAGSTSGVTSEAGPAPEDFDIEAAINNALSGK